MLKPAAPLGAILCLLAGHHQFIRAYFSVTIIVRSPRYLFSAMSFLRDLGLQLTVVIRKHAEETERKILVIFPYVFHDGYRRPAPAI